MATSYNNQENIASFNYEYGCIPVLEITNQPADTFRYRYESETGTHGKLHGRNGDKTFPTVELKGYHHNESIKIKVSLLMKVQNEQFRDHVHALVGECEVYAEPKNKYCVEFNNLRIDQLTKKKAENKIKEVIRNEFITEKLGSKDLDKKVKEVDINCAFLKFEAVSQGGAIFCETISEPIHNGKSSTHSKLKICRLDKIKGLCTGDEEVFLLCEKVTKNNIKIIFRGNCNGEPWQAEGIFKDHDIHHQYAIVFKTPAFGDKNIKEDIKVEIFLYRPKDNACSESVEFIYTPVDDDGIARKKQKSMKNVEDDLSRFGNYNPTSYGSNNVKESPFIPNYYSSQSLSSMQRSNNVNVYNLSNESNPLLSQTMPEDEELFESLSVNPPFESESDFRLDGRSLSDIDNYKIAEAQGELSNIRFESADGVPVSAINKPGIMTQTSNLSDPSVSDDAYRLTVRSAQTLYEFAHTGDICNLLYGIRHLIAIQDENGDNVIHISVINGYYETVRNLVRVARSIPHYDAINARNKLYQVPLHIALYTQKPEIVHLLLRHGANPNSTDKYGNSCLHIAAQLKAPYCLQTLLHGSTHGDPLDLHSINFIGQTALHVAVLANSLGNVRLLCKSGADINAEIRTCGKTALHLAVENQNNDILQFLIDENAEVDKQMFNGNTPLHLASSMGNYLHVGMLLKASADPLIENYHFKKHDSDISDDENDETKNNEKILHGLTPYDVAESNYIQQILKREIIVDLSASHATVIPEVPKEERIPETKITPSGDHESDSGIGLSSQFSGLSIASNDDREGLDIDLSSSSIKSVSVTAKLKLIELLDPPNEGWRKLAKALYLNKNDIRKLENAHSPTLEILNNNKDVKRLRDALQAIKCSDGIECLDH